MFSAMASESTGTYAKVAPSAYRLASRLGLQSRQPDPVVRHVELAIGLDRRFALIADIHADLEFMPARAVERIVDLAGEHGPFDAVLVPGDFAGHDPAALAGPARALGRFEAPVFFTNGNHDHMLGAGRVALALRNNGVTVLDNEAVPLEDSPGAPWIAGIDSMAGNPDPDRALAEIPAAAPVVVVGHEPKLATMHDEVLHVAGHTHHGQVRVPGAPPILRPRHSQPYPAGLYMEETGERIRPGSTHRTRWIYTTAGVGTTTFPLRVSCPPEIVVIDT